jgi:hypothetical protein
MTNWEECGGPAGGSLANNTESDGQVTKFNMNFKRRAARTTEWRRLMVPESSTLFQHNIRTKGNSVDPKENGDIV